VTGRSALDRTADRNSRDSAQTFSDRTSSTICDRKIAMGRLFDSSIAHPADVSAGFKGARGAAPGKGHAGFAPDRRFSC
jgi:hypothetical protein